MRKWLLLCIMLSAGGAFAEEPINIYGYDIKSSTYTDSSQELRGKHHGGRQAFLAELTRELMIKLNLTPDIIPIEKTGASRAAKMNGPHGFLGIRRTSDNANDYQWVGPLLEESSYFIKRRDSDIRLATVEDAKRAASVCVRTASPQVQPLKERGFTNIDYASSYKACWDRVADGRSDLTLLSAVLFPTIEKIAGVTVDKLSKTDVVIADEAFLAFPNGTPLETVKKWRGALEAIKTSGRYSSLVHHYYCRQDCF